MKHILLIATGGTIASKYTKDGLSPAITAQELLTYIPAAGAFCQIDTVQPFFLDSTNVGPDQWLILADLIEKKYDHYDGFVICHGQTRWRTRLPRCPIWFRTAGSRL